MRPRTATESCQLFPPGFTLEAGIALCMNQLGLTRAESVVAVLLVEEHSPTRVMERLGSKPGTVRSHLRSIMTKLGVGSSVGVVAVVLARLWAAFHPLE